MKYADLHAALLHEMKNNLVLLAMTLDTIPHVDDAGHDDPLDASRLLCQRISERLQQALMLHKADEQAIRLHIDAYPPADFIDELVDTARSLARDRFQVDAQVADDIPSLWFFDRNLAEMALINAIHNSLTYAKTRIVIGARLEDGMLCLYVHDDSTGFPEEIIDAVAQGESYKSAGTGLGLQFARLIAQTHVNKGRHGELQLGNDHGAVFCMRLP